MSDAADNVRHPLRDALLSALATLAAIAGWGVALALIGG